ncbi:methyltransferase domain-containing protein [Citricoccus nitrophenolicus]|uniref:Methyltransferase domain-containing protein n=1 Tax=Citricoccus nitrophenolicus TaxID=863575 RepID=A0ABV0IDS6_9MICC|nr:methyltransferase domain-containing protein [Citricoccus sp. I39-566]WMY77292.1 methyltransferase domain-containing protein [Citricoccus sp. I39-566]
MQDFTWDPEQYTVFADRRARPFRDLTARIRAADPKLVVDLGCGPGNMTRTLAERWPQARVIGLDSSADMVETAQQMAAESGLDNLSFDQVDAQRWQPDADVDVVVSNAMLQWIPDHRQLVAGWLEALRPGAWFAVQVPGNFAAPSHATIAEMSRRPEFTAALHGVMERESVYTTHEYLETLIASGFEADVWETTYSQPLTGNDPVYDWVRGAALRPSLQRLEAADRRDGTNLQERYVEEYRRIMRESYQTYITPEGVRLTDYPFRRIFMVGVKSDLSPSI